MNRLPESIAELVHARSVEILGAVGFCVPQQEALARLEIVRSTVTATDQGTCSDLVEITESLRGTSKPVVHRTLAPERVDAAVEMLAARRR